MCSFIIIVVSAASVRFELKSESVRLWSTVMKPRERGVVGPVLLGAELLARLAGRGAVAEDDLAVPLRLRRERGPGRRRRVEQDGDVVDAAVDRAALDANDVRHREAGRRRGRREVCRRDAD